MKLNTIHHIAIIVSDYERSRDFYVNKLGFSVIRENYRPARDDWKLDLRINETTELEIFGVRNPPKRITGPEAAGLRHLAFYAEDLDGMIAELEQMGIEVEPVRVDEFTVCNLQKYTGLWSLLSERKGCGSFCRNFRGDRFLLQRD